MAGDSLARGARSATFGPAKSVSQKKWDEIWAEDSEKPKPRCPLTGKRYHHDGGNDHYDYFSCVRDEGHAGQCADY